MYTSPSGSVVQCSEIVLLQNERKELLYETKCHYSQCMYMYVFRLIIGIMVWFIYQHHSLHDYCGYTVIVTWFSSHCVWINLMSNSKLCQISKETQIVSTGLVGLIYFLY